MREQLELTGTTFGCGIAQCGYCQPGQLMSALAKLLADELDADWSKIRIEEVPALGEYAHYSLGKNFMLKGMNFPDAVVPSIDGAMMNLLRRPGRFPLTKSSRKTAILFIRRAP